MRIATGLAIADLTVTRYAMGHVLLLSCRAPPLEAAVDEARELGRELGRRLGWLAVAVGIYAS